MTSFIGMHLARYIGQDGVKSLVTGEASNDVTVAWDDPKVLAAAESFADFADKGYFSKNIATNKYPAGQNQEFAPGESFNRNLWILASERSKRICSRRSWKWATSTIHQFRRNR